MQYIEQKDYKKICWMCNLNEANSKEHKYKNSDLKHLLNNIEDSVIKKIGRKREIHGSKSSLLKFEKVLCENCNNEKSKNIDNDYDLFSNEYIKPLNKKITLINLENENFRLNVYRYLTKNFCCRLASNNINISEDLSNFVNGYIKCPKRLIIKVNSNNNETELSKIYLTENKVPNEIALFGSGKLLKIGKFENEIYLIYSTLILNNLIFEFFYMNFDSNLEKIYSETNIVIKQFETTKKIELRVNEILRNYV